jgi:hypothetical protein
MMLARSVSNMMTLSQQPLRRPRCFSKGDRPSRHAHFVPSSHSRSRSFRNLNSPIRHHLPGPSTDVSLAASFIFVLLAAFAMPLAIPAERRAIYGRCAGNRDATFQRSSHRLRMKIAVPFIRCRPRGRTINFYTNGWFSSPERNILLLWTRGAASQSFRRTCCIPCARALP